MAALAVLAGRLVVRSQRGQTHASGKGLLVGTRVTVRDVAPRPAGGSQGRAFCDGTWWRVRGAGALAEGQTVQVADMDGLTLVVEPVPAPPVSPNEE
jgi:membrane protein implicated in regulation of membrane protease activity